MTHLLGEDFLNRTVRHRALLFLGLLVPLLGTFGIYTLHRSPVLFLDTAGSFSLSAPDIRSIAHVNLDPAFFRVLPEFFTPSAEAQWWQQQEQVYTLLQQGPSVAVEWLGKDGVLRMGQAQVGRLPFLEVINRTWLIYLVALLYLSSVRSVFRHHQTAPGTILAFFFLACALYFTAAAPVVTRPITLQPFSFQLLIFALYTAAGGMITLVHFALVFPAPKTLLTKHLWLPLILYGSFGLTVGLYLTGLIAFGITFPVFCFWIVVLIGAFLHSFLAATNPFFKKQIGLSLLAPILASLFFVLFLLPGVLGRPQVPFTSFALFSLILPFALPFAMDNLALYQQQLAATRNAQHEKERLREDLHDLVLGNLAVISRVVEVALSCLESAGTEVKQQLKAAQDLASDTARQVREFLWILDPAHDSWDELCSHLHRWGHELMEKVGLDFTLAVTPAVLVLPPPSVSMKVCVERGYKEALVNIVKHAQAQMVRGTLSCRADTLVCEIHNNGNGFDPDATTEGHYGLSLIRKRVQELGGELTIDAKVGQGTRITLRLALR